jgi:glycosyltransferase involved in cell wall biosynthesis
MKKGISVIICCYNSATRLPETLRHIAQQNVPDDLAWEVIVINNNSHDNTDTIAKSEWEKYATKALFRVINEPKPGLSNARKTGILSANYEYTIFCDDDNWLNSEYVRISYEVINGNPEIGMLGGQSEAACEVTPPKWFSEKKFAYAIGVQGEQSGDITSRGFMWGAGVVLRTKVLRTIYNSGIDSLLSGRIGNKLNAGDDAEISCWHLMLGYKFWFDDRLLFKHYIPKERLTDEYVQKLIEGFDRSSPIMSGYYRIIDYQKELINRKYLEVFLKSTYKFLLITMGILPYKQNLPRLKENLQISSNSIVVFNRNLAIVQRKIFKRLIRLKSRL